MALDHPTIVDSLTVIDIVPTIEEHLAPFLGER